MTFTREKDTEAWIRKEVEKLGGVFLKFTSPGNDGVPDRIAIFPDSRLVFVELKKHGAKPRPLQIRQIEKIRKLGFRVEVIDSEQGIQELIGSIGAKNKKEDNENV